MTRYRLCLVLLVELLCLGSCAPCERRGCDAYQRTASATIRQGVAGAVANLSDVVGNGCQECPLAQATLQIWRAENPITTADAAKALATTTPTSVVEADRHYEFALDPADYLLCAPDGVSAVVAPCAAFTVSASRVTTINVKLRFGQTSLLVFDANMSAPRQETFDFSAK